MVQQYDETMKYHSLTIHPKVKEGEELTHKNEHDSTVTFTIKFTETENIISCVEHAGFQMAQPAHVARSWKLFSCQACGSDSVGRRESLHG